MLMILIELSEVLAITIQKSILCFKRVKRPFVKEISKRRFRKFYMRNYFVKLFIYTEIISASTRNLIHVVEATKGKGAHCNIAIKGNC